MILIVSIPFDFAVCPLVLIGAVCFVFVCFLGLLFVSLFLDLELWSTLNLV